LRVHYASTFTVSSLQVMQQQHLTDKGYDTDPILNHLRQRGITAVIPRRYDAARGEIVVHQL
jgi:hypothetical protein